MSAGNDREFIDFLQSKEKGGRSMKCPLITAGFWADRHASGKEAIDCLKEQCAWWAHDSEMCCILDICADIEGIHMALNDLVDKMPKWEQFGK